MKNNTLQKKESSLPFVFLSLIALAAMVARSFFSIVTTDEAFNIGQAYRTVIGQKFMIENWDYFQFGDSLNYPFIYLFCKISGSTEGIILYSRFCFIFISLVFAVITYKLLKPMYGRTSAFAVSIIYYSMVTKTMFSYWYDTWSIAFMLLSFLLILCAQKNGGTASCFILAGACQAISAYCYPTAVIVFLAEFILLFIFLDKQKKKFSFKKPEMYYALGAAAVFFIFVAFCLTKDWQSFFIFNKDVAMSGLADRIETSKTVIAEIKDFLYGFCAQFITSIIASAAFGVLCFITKKCKLSKAFLVIYALISSFAVWFITFYQIRYTTGGKTQMQLYILLYWSMCALYMHLIFYRKNKLFHNCFVFLFIPAIIAGLVWTFSGEDGTINFALGARPAALLFILELYDLISQIKLNKKRNAAVLVTSLFLVLNIFMLFGCAFQSNNPQKILQSESGFSQTQSGIYKGIYDVTQKSDELVDFENELNGVIEEGDKTILCGRKIIYGYLMTDLKPNTNYLWRPGILGGDTAADDYYDILFKYFDSYYGEPDIIVLRKDEKELQNSSFSEFLNNNYQIKAQSSDYIFYHTK